MMIDLLNCQVDIACPNCGYVFEILLKQVAAQETIICPGCRQEIHLVDEAASTAHAERDIHNMLLEVCKTVSRMGG